MGRQGRFTGSKLLGAELRRLRGGRTLAQVAALSKRPPLSTRVQPISAPSLSQIENGLTFPGLDALHTLATVYQHPMQQLLDLVFQERALERFELPDDISRLREGFLDAFNAGRWHEALAHATKAERTCGEAGLAVAWRGNRAACLQRIGLRDDAVHLLLRCAHDPDAPKHSLYQIYRTLAEAMHAAGYPVAAAEMAAKAVSLAPADLDPGWRWPLMTTRATLLLQEQELSSEVDERRVREALRLLQSALPLIDEREANARLTLRIGEAIARKLLGNETLAIELLSEIVDEAAERACSPARILALLALGRIHARRRHWARARTALAECERLAIDTESPDEVFEACFESYQVAKSTIDGRAAQFYKRCERYLPMVQARTPQVIAFERLAQGQ